MSGHFHNHLENGSNGILGQFSGCVGNREKFWNNFQKSVDANLKCYAESFVTL